jgi:predicted GIY-YIG superfamily endonuclease
MENFYVYILQSTSNDSFYKGSTNDLLRRFKEHNSGKDFATRRFLPWNLVWFTNKPSKAEAYQLEKKLKNLSAIRTIEFINKYPVTNLVEGVSISAVRVQS